MREMKYILVDGQPVLEPDPIRWAAWFESADRRVALNKTGREAVSTVFLGIDHNFGGSGKPVLYETMVFGGPLNGHQRRYATEDEALTGHAEVLAAVKAAVRED